MYRNDYDKGYNLINDILRKDDIDTTEESVSVYELCNIYNNYFNSFYEHFHNNKKALFVKINDYNNGKHDFKVYPYYDEEGMHIAFYCEELNVCYWLDKEYGNDFFVYDPRYFYYALSYEYSKRGIAENSDFGKVIFNNADCVAQISELFEVMEYYKKYSNYLGLQLTDFDKKVYNNIDFPIVTGGPDSHGFNWKLCMTTEGLVSVSSLGLYDINDASLCSYRSDKKYRLNELLECNTDAILKKIPVELNSLSPLFMNLYLFNITSLERPNPKFSLKK